MTLDAAGTIKIKELGEVTRLGFGAMHQTGEGIWGEPDDIERAYAVVRRAVELGVNFIDTADSYGPEVSERIIREALHPYAPGLKIGTKAGQVRPGPGQWVPVGRPEYLRQQVEMSLRNLGVEKIDLFQLHRVDPHVPASDQFGVMAELQKEGKVQALGLSEVGVDLIREAEKYFTVASVQNQYNLIDRKHEDVVEYCTENEIAFIPWHPLAAGDLAAPGGVVDDAAKRLDATHSQVALAWLLQHSPMILPIPGTSSPTHLEENLKAADLTLDEQTVSELNSAV